MTDEAPHACARCGAPLAGAFAPCERCDALEPRNEAGRGPLASIRRRASIVLVGLGLLLTLGSLVKDRVAREGPFREAVDELAAILPSRLGETLTVSAMTLEEGELLCTITHEGEWSGTTDPDLPAVMAAVVVSLRADPRVRPVLARGDVRLRFRLTSPTGDELGSRRVPPDTFR